MYWVEYLDYDLAGNLNRPLGDRGIVILDGRNSIQTMRENAQQINGNGRPFYPAAQIYRGETLNRGRKPITEVFYL